MRAGRKQECYVIGTLVLARLNEGVDAVQEHPGGIERARAAGVVGGDRRAPHPPPVHAAHRRGTRRKKHPQK